MSHCTKHYVTNQTRLVCPTDVTLHQTLCHKSDETCLSYRCHTAPNIMSQIRQDLFVLQLSHCTKHYVINQTSLVCPNAVTLHQTLCHKSDETCLSYRCHTAPNIMSQIRRDLFVLQMSHCTKHYVTNQTRLVCPTAVTLHQTLRHKSDKSCLS